MNDKHFEETGAEVGRSIGRIIDQLGSKLSFSDSNKKSQQKSQEKSTDDFVESIIAYFKSKTGIEILSESVEDMNIETVLNWVNTLPDFEANQLFIVKGYIPEDKKHIFCAFFAINDQPLLDKNDYKKCFICDSLNKEIQDVFGDKNIYLIPLS